MGDHVGGNGVASGANRHPQGQSQGATEQISVVAQLVLPRDRGSRDRPAR